MVVMPMFFPVPCAMRQRRAYPAEASLRAAGLRDADTWQRRTVPRCAGPWCSAPWCFVPRCSVPVYRASPDVDAAMAADRTPANSPACSCMRRRAAAPVRAKRARAAGWPRSWSRAVAPRSIIALTIIDVTTAPRACARRAHAMTSTRDGGNDVLLSRRTPGPFARAAAGPAVAKFDPRWVAHAAAALH
jgi:hypothetical protein